MDRKPILQYVLNRLGSISKLFCIFFGGEGGRTDWTVRRTDWKVRRTDWTVRRTDWSSRESEIADLEALVPEIKKKI